MPQHNNDVRISRRDKQEVRQLELLEVLLRDFRLSSFRSHRQWKRPLRAWGPIAWLAHHRPNETHRPKAVNPARRTHGRLDVVRPIKYRRLEKERTRRRVDFRASSCGPFQHAEWCRTNCQGSSACAIRIHLLVWRETSDGLVST